MIIIPITVTNSFSNFDFIVESFKLAGTYLMFCMIDKSRQSFFLNFRKMNQFFYRRESVLYNIQTNSLKDLIRNYETVILLSEIDK